MEFNTSYNFYCGTSRGFIASTLWKKDDTNVPKPHYNNDHKGEEISSFEFGRSTNEIIIGAVKGNVRLYDVVTRSYSPSEVLCTSESSEVIGSGIIQDNIIYCQQNGIVTFWHPENERTTNFIIPISKDENLRKFRRNEYRDNLFAVAGHKLEYTLWDMEQKKVIFAAKSLPSDQLYQLPQTTLANDLCTVNFGGGHIGAIVTAEGVTMLYDDRAQRRPVLILKKESIRGAQTSFTCIKPAKGLDHLLTAGTTRGAVHLIDLRVKQGYVGAITGYNGAVTSLAPMGVGSESAIASTCLDGNLRVHCVQTKKLLYKIYMKVALKGVLIQTTIYKKKELKENEPKVVESTDLDNIFATMETIDDENESDLNIQKENSEVLKENTKVKSQKVKNVKSKLQMQEKADEVVEIKPLEMKPAELQRLWKQDIATLISTDPFKLHMDYLLSKEIKIEDDDELVQNEKIIDEVLEDNASKMQNLKRKNDEMTSQYEDITEDNLITKLDKSRNTKTKLKGISIIEVTSKSKSSKNFEKKKSKKTIIRIKTKVG